MVTAYLVGRFLGLPLMMSMPLLLAKAAIMRFSSKVRSRQKRMRAASSRISTGSRLSGVLSAKRSAGPTPKSGGNAPHPVLVQAAVA